jgi:DNA-binding XRE family transcriptional regulator
MTPHIPASARMILIVRGTLLIVNIPMARMGKRADILVRFGQRVRELRKEQGYSQENFAAACDLDRTYIGGIERGERNLALRNIDAIADTLGMTLAELMEGL